jgi:hypothetical protein
MVPPNPAHWDDQEQLYRSGSTTWDDIHQQIVRDNAAFRDAADSRGFDAAHLAGAILAEEAKTIAEWHAKVADKCANIATVLRDTRAAQEQTVREADKNIASAKLPGEAETLLATYREFALYQTEAGVAAAVALQTSFRASAENTSALAILTKYGPDDAQTAPRVERFDAHSGNTTQDDDPYHYRAKPVAGPDAPPRPDRPPADAAGREETQAGIGAGELTSPGLASPTGTARLAPATPLRGMPALPRMGGGGAPGGLPGGLPGLAGGGLPGLSPGGLGEMPGMGGRLPSAAGVPGSAGAGSPVAAFSRGLSTGAGIGGGVPSMPPAAPPSSLLPLSSGVSAAPVAAAGGAVPPPVSPPRVMAASSGPVAGVAAGVGGVGAPMMLPPGSMGPPAGAVPSPVASTVPAGTVGGGGGGAPSAAVAPTTAGGGATLIPASVVAAGRTAEARERRESSDAAAAKELAWKLQHAAVSVNFGAIEWAVGVFRSPSGTETVITSNDGASFIPHGVYVPRSVRLLSADALVDDHFRQLWFGWADPARVLVEYAGVRAESGWRLVAAATTGAVTALRDAGVEHPPSCSRDVNPLLRQGERPVAAPTLDGLHVHRLSLVCPDMYPRLLRVMDSHPLYQDRIVNAVSALLLDAATTHGQRDCRAAQCRCGDGQLEG